MKEKALNFLTLFSSVSTLFCCALPALFVTLGLGATFAGLISTIPQLVWFSENKVLVFIFAGVMLTLGGYLQWRARIMACPTDPKLREACQTARPWSLWLYLFSLTLYGIGLFFAYGLG